MNLSSPHTLTRQTIRSRPPPSPPDLVGWSQAERSAEMLRGTLVRCGPGLRLAAWPETPRVRAYALAPWLAGNRIAVRLSAAWVWGAARDAKLPLQLSTRDGRRARSPGTPDYALHQLTLQEADVQRFGPYSVTTPTRTVLDLLRDPAALDLRSRVACRLLFVLVPGGHDTIRQALDSGSRPYRAHALRKLEVCAP